MSKPKIFSILLLAFFTTPGLASADLVVADFNDNLGGPLGNQAGGIGWAVGSSWENPSGTFDVVAGDLTAPGSTNYGVSQSGTEQSVQGGTLGIGFQTNRDVADALSGAVWFSFLLNQPDLDSRGGISFNNLGEAAANPRVIMVGDELRLGLVTTQGVGGGYTISSAEFQEDMLILGRLQIDPTGMELLEVWVNPDVAGGIAGLGAADNTLMQDAMSLDAGITRIGLQSYTGASLSMGGIIDSLRISDRDSIFFDVTTTSIPEPRAAGLLVVFIVVLVSTRRRFALA